MVLVSTKTTNSTLKNNHSHYSLVTERMRSQQASRYNEAALALEKKHCYAQSGHKWESIDLRLWLLEEKWRGLIEKADTEFINRCMLVKKGSKEYKWKSSNQKYVHVYYFCLTNLICCWSCVVPATGPHHISFLSPLENLCFIELGKNIYILISQF